MADGAEPSGSYINAELAPSMLAILKAQGTRVCHRLYGDLTRAADANQVPDPLWIGPPGPSHRRTLRASYWGTTWTAWCAKRRTP